MNFENVMSKLQSQLTAEIEATQRAAADNASYVQTEKSNKQETNILRDIGLAIQRR